MIKDDSLLKLEKKLENSSTQDIVINKFNFSKPNMKLEPNSKINFQGLNEFLIQLKESNKELEQNKEKYNIEQNLSDNSDSNSSNGEPQIEMNLALGVLEKKPQKDLNPNDIISSLNNEDNILNEGEKELIKFIVDNNKNK